MKKNGSDKKHPFCISLLAKSLKFGQRASTRWLFFCATFQTGKALAKAN
jgi:hypothetical protein